MGGQFLGAEGRREVAVYLGGGLAKAVCLAGEVPARLRRVGGVARVIVADTGGGQ